jgi:hypothetical protein
MLSAAVYCLQYYKKPEYKPEEKYDAHDKYYQNKQGDKYYDKHDDDKHEEKYEREEVSSRVAVYKQQVIVVPTLVRMQVSLAHGGACAFVVGRCQGAVECCTTSSWR